MSRLRPHAAPIAVAALTVAGLVFRVDLFRESLIADEMSTVWIITTNGLGGVWSTVHTDAEITPPLFFLTSWLAAQLYDAPEMVRLPSLLAGTATIPVIYLLGLRTVGRGAAVVAAAVVALSPFTVFHSSEARSYALMIVLVALSTLFMLLAVDTRRRVFWVLYGVVSCAAMYTHYTSAFVLATQLAWLFWTHPEARRPALVANVAAAVAFLPWLSGLQADLDSPTTKILSALSPFDADNIRSSLTRAVVGYPYSLTPLRELPGIVPLILFAAGLLLGLAGVARRAFRDGPRAWLAQLDRRIVLMVALALTVPLCTALVSAVGTNLFSTRNLAASWPGWALCVGALLMAAGSRLRIAAVACVLVSLAVGAFDLALDDSSQRPDYKAAAAFINDSAAQGDVLVDGAVLSPGPLGPLDVALGQPQEIVRFDAPVQRDHPFAIFDRSLTRPEALADATQMAGDNRVFMVYATGASRFEPELFPAGWRMRERHTFPGNRELQVEIWAPR
jgi:hypothetical protein